MSSFCSMHSKDEEESAHRYFLNRIENAVIQLNGWKLKLELFRLELKYKVSTDPIINKEAIYPERKHICYHPKPLK